MPWETQTQDKTQQYFLGEIVQSKKVQFDIYKSNCVNPYQSYNFGQTWSNIPKFGLLQQQINLVKLPRNT